MAPKKETNAQAKPDQAKPDQAKPKAPKEPDQAKPKAHKEPDQAKPKAPKEPDQAKPIKIKKEPKVQVEPKAPKEKKTPKVIVDQAQPMEQAKQEQAKQEQAKQAQPKEQAKQEQAVSIVLIETNGTIKTLKTKEVSLDTLYKKCGFRVNEDFLCRHTWALTLKGTKEQYKVSLWGKKTGKANFENKYDLPPPLDKELFFGTCALVRTSVAGASSEGTGSNVLLDLTKETWLKIYEQLFGGFEDIGNEDEFSEDELENVDPALLTKDGYLKDDFVVSDKEAISAATSASEADTASAESEADEETDAEACETESEESASASASEADEADESETKKTKPKKKVVKKGGKKAKEEEIDDTSELEEEVYTFSDDE